MMGKGILYFFYKQVIFMSTDEGGGQSMELRYNYIETKENRRNKSDQAQV